MDVCVQIEGSSVAQAHRGLHLRSNLIFGGSAGNSRGQNLSHVTSQTGQHIVHDRIDTLPVRSLSLQRGEGLGLEGGQIGDLGLRLYCHQQRGGSSSKGGSLGFGGGGKS